MSAAALPTDHSRRLPWLFSPTIDLAAFLGSAVLALLALAFGSQLGWLEGHPPEWTWVPAVLMIDVAHVWATAFRVYFDPRELKRRFGLYLFTPAVAFLAGVILYGFGEMVFWRVLAYLAVFHFVRQQYGWVALYRARGGELGRVGWWIDAAAIYLATLYPLLYWHAHLPRRFWWFLENDFAALPPILVSLVAPLYWLALSLYAIRSLSRGLREGAWNPGKDVVVATTAVCWYVGIITFNSDYAFLVTNVIIHGVPYLVLVYWSQFRRVEAAETGRSTARGRGWQTVVIFLATVWLLAFLEELCWDRGVWHERSWLFGTAWRAGTGTAFLVPLLAVPQMTHYMLDGFIWRRRANPDLARMVGPSSATTAATSVRQTPDPVRV